MHQAQVLLPDGERTLQQRLSVRLLVVGDRVGGQRVETHGDLQVVGSERRLEKLEGLLVTGPGFVQVGPAARAGRRDAED